MSEEIWVEALSSTLYFWRNANTLKIEKTKNSIVAGIIEINSECQTEHIKAAWNCLIKHKLIKAQPSRYDKLFKPKAKNT